MRIALIFLLSSVSAHAQNSGEQAVNLSDLGLSSFTPYISERNPWWILLPALTLLTVVAHLPFFWNKKAKKITK